MSNHLVMSIPAAAAVSTDPLDQEDRRRWLIAASGVAGLGLAATAVPFVRSFTPSERAKAMGSSVEVDLSDIAPGGVKTVEWRGKPVWIMRRTPAQQALLAQPNAALADAQSERDQQPAYAKNALRSINAEWFVGVGICTHLGCSPNVVPQGTTLPSVGTDWPGGFFCPCHGSTFDLAGRVYRNKPAPNNLEVPPHQFLSGQRLVVGEDADTPA